MNKQKKDKSAIYEIRNLVNDKIYIGSATYVYSRWGQHRMRLRKQNHYNSHLQTAWNLYGEKNFKFKIIENVFDKTFLIEREQYYIDITECYNSKKGYNINRLASSNLGRKWSQETKNKISKTIKKIITKEHLDLMTQKARLVNLGNHPTKEAIKNRINARARHWILISPKGEEYKIQNLKQFSIENGLNQSCLVRVSQGKAIQHKGWKCLKISIHKDGIGRKLTEEQKRKMKGRVQSQASIEKIKKSKCKTYLIISPSGEEIIVNNLPNFCKEKNLRVESFHRVARKERKHYHGYKCTKIELDK